ncbi:MAG: hypothetical protein ACT4PL_10290 [Phycisphaerales bacterium]
MKTTSFVASLALLGTAGSALAVGGTVNTGFSFDFTYQTPGVQFVLNNVAITEPTATFRGDRIDGNPGTDTTVADRFTAYCVELGRDVLNPTVGYTACDLFGSTTNSGGVTGPITFDAVKTDRLQRLWGTFEATVDTVDESAAFQLAIWEIAFDGDMTLLAPGVLFSLPGNPNDFYTNLAEGYLTVIRNGGGISVPLILLTQGPLEDSQDVITTPTPSGAALVGLGAIAAMRRRRR